MLQINTFHYSPEDVDCTRCAKYGGKKQGCTVKACPWLAERIEAGVVGYAEAETPSPMTPTWTPACVP